MKVRVLPRMTYDVLAEDGHPIGTFMLAGTWNGMMKLTEIGGLNAELITEQAPMAEGATVRVYRADDAFLSRVR